MEIINDSFFANRDVGINVLSEGGKWIVEIACPGFTAKDVIIEILPEKILRVRGEINEHKAATFHIKELKSVFERRVRLPDFIVNEPVAVMKNGLLSLTWTVTSSEKKKIQIKDES